VLLQPFWKTPVTVIPDASNNNVLYCVYDNDVNCLLLKIDFSKRFQPPAPGSLLSPIVLESTCAVDNMQPTDTNEWDMVADAIKAIPTAEFRQQSIPMLDLVFYRRYFERDDVVQILHQRGWYDYSLATNR
jgi:hypothetical protein